MRERDIRDHRKQGSADNHNHNVDELRGKEGRRSGRDSHSRHGERHTSVKEIETDHYKESHKAGGGHKKSRQEVHFFTLLPYSQGREMHKNRKITVGVETVYNI